jgi:hypothetical protein
MVAMSRGMVRVTVIFPERSGMTSSSVLSFTHPGKRVSRASAASRTNARVGRNVTDPPRLGPRLFWMGFASL